MAAKPVAVPQTVTVNANSSVTITLKATDAENNALTYGIFTPPSHGTVTTPAGDKVTYTPAPGYTGTDSFTFRATDAEGFSEAATVSITVTDDDFLLTFVAGTLIPAIKQKQQQELEAYINSLTLNDATLQSCFPGTVPQGRPLYELTTFTCQDKDLSAASMAELGKLVNLQTLELRYSKLTDIGALSNLTKLTRLDLEFNELTDSSASALSRMTNLTYLNLGFNNFTSTSFLANMNKLQELHLDANQLTGIGDLTGKTTLRKLWLDDNRFTNLSPLSNLTGLTHLGLGYNRRPADGVAINNLSYLQNLTNLQVLMLDGNDITADLNNGTGALTRMEHMQELYLRGNDIEVLGSSSLFPTAPTYNQRLWVSLERLELGFNKIGNISILSSFVNLTHLGLEYNQIEDASALYGLSDLQQLALEHNQIRETSSVTGFGLNSLSALNSYLDLRGNLLLDVTPLAAMPNSFTLLADDNCLGSIVMPSRIRAFGHYWQFPASRCDDPTQNDKPVAYPQETVTFQNAPSPLPITLAGADPEGSGLTYTIESSPAHGSLSNTGTLASPELTYTPNGSYVGEDTFTFSVKEPGATGLQSTLSTVSINVRAAPILNDFTLLNCFGAAKDVPDNTALAALESFSCDNINLSGANLAALSSLSALKSLALNHATLSNISALGSLTGLTGLYLQYNQISNISALNNMTQLTWVNLGANQISSITALRNKPLISLILNGNLVNNISDISTIAGLQELHIESNGILDINPLADLNKVSILSLRSNRLQNNDLTALEDLSQTLTLYLEGNCLTDASVLPDNITVIGLGAGANPPQRPVTVGECPTP